MRFLATILCLAAMTGCQTQSFAANTNRVELVFELDEGLPTSLLQRYADVTAERTKRVERALDALRPLTRYYHVSLLVYPTHYYDIAGKTPRERIEAPLWELFTLLARPENQDFGLWLEAYSSGIRTSQDGHHASVPMAPVHFSDTGLGRPGWGMDVETLAFLKQQFPKTFCGVRFHEVFGSYAAWVATKGKVGFKPDAEVVKAAIDLCAQYGMNLMWGDSVWLTRADCSGSGFVHSAEHPAFFEAKPYVEWLREASARLGDRLILNQANNNYHPGPDLEFWTGNVTDSRKGIVRPIPNWMRYEQKLSQCPLEDFVPSRWGISVQSWVWGELLHTLTGRYYAGGEMICPPSAIVVQSLDALQKGASVLQFEPSWYFFHDNYRSNAPGMKRIYDDHSSDDFEPRFGFLDLREALLVYAENGRIQAKMSDLYDPDLQRLCEDDESAVPRLPWSCVAAIVPRKIEPFVRQTGPGVGQRLPFDHPWWNDTFDSIGRIDLDGNGSDDFFGIKQNHKSTEIWFFNSLGGLIDTVALPEPVTGSERVFAGNVISKVEESGDPDEILVAGTNTLRIYRIKRKAGDHVGVDGLERADKELEEKWNLSSFPGGGIPTLVRTSRAIYPDNTRPLDLPIRIPAKMSATTWAQGDWIGDGHDELFTLSLDGALSIWSLHDFSKPLVAFATPIRTRPIQLLVLNRGIYWNATKPSKP